MSDEDLETFRHRCEVRWLLQLYGREGKTGVNRYIGLVRDARGDECADRLLSDCRDQYARGNRGFEKGEWRA